MTMPHKIEQTAVYDLATAREALDLAETTLPRAIRRGQLRASRRAGKYLILGQWLLDWIAAGRSGETATGRDRGKQGEQQSCRSRGSDGTYQRPV